ncbi:MAG: peptide deformylase [Peptococcaceae bacterium]|nr:peptide deformylase [Peptococcaceae bacterium]
MARYKVVLTGDPVLRKISKPVKEVNDHIKRLMDNMAETMYHAKGVGLAAPQVGYSKRVIVVDIGDGLYKLANPEIIHSSGLQDGPEGCLSVPGTIGDVKRSENVTVRALNENNEEVTIEASGFKARAFQHEIDHLNGIIFTDKATNIEQVVNQ